MSSILTKGDFILAPGEKYVQCPYNQAHIVTNAKIIQHLSKCRKGYGKECEKAGKGIEMRTCNFNSNHKVLAPEIEMHHEECEDRFHLCQTIRYHESDKFKRKMDDDRRRKEKILKTGDMHEMDDDQRQENWDFERRGEVKIHKNGDMYRDKEKEWGLGSSSYRRRDNDRNHSPRRRDWERVVRQTKAQDFDGGNGSGGRSEDNGDKGFFKDYGHGYKVGDESVCKEPKSTDDGTSSKKESIWGGYAEDWDAEAKGYESAYNPEEKLQAEVIMYQPWGLTKSERKKYRSDQKFKALRWDSSQKDGEPFGNLDLEVGDTFGGLKETPIWKRNDVEGKHEPFIDNRKLPPKMADLSEKEDGECSDDDYEPFIGEDPFS